MKKRTFLTMLLVLLVLAAWAEGETIVTSFYPVHVLTLMVTDGIDALETKQMAQQQNQASGAASSSAGGSSVTSLPAGDKGKIVDVNNKLMFCVVEFTDEAMKEMLGPERNGSLPALTLGIRRKGFGGPAGEFVGKIRLRQSVSGKNYVIADILGDWSQANMEKGDAVFAE